MSLSSGYEPAHGLLPLLVRQEFAIHGDFYAVAPGIRDFFDVEHEIYCAHDAGAEFLLDDRLHGRAIANALAIADELEQLSRDERHSFGMIEPNAAREALLREKAGVVVEELVDFAR